MFAVLVCVVLADLCCLFVLLVLLWCFSFVLFVCVCVVFCCGCRSCSLIVLLDCVFLLLKPSFLFVLSVLLDCVSLLFMCV